MDKRPTNLPTMTVTFEEGPLAGHEFLMYEPPSQLIFGVAEIKRSDFGRAALEAVVDSTLDVPDIWKIPPTWAVALATGWMEAWREAALPPAKGRGSRKPSPSQHLTSLAG